jgi:hypothetical protein
MFWGSRTEGLRTGMPQNEATEGGNFFAALFADPLKLEGFLKAMTGLSFGAALALAKRFPWKQYKTFVDAGCAQGESLVQVALAHPHLTGGGMDLLVVQRIFDAYVREHGLEGRL